MIWEVFQMHSAQKPMCSHCAEITCHQSRPRTPGLGRTLASCLHVFHFTGMMWPAQREEPQRPNEWTFKKGHLVPLWRLHTTPTGCSIKPCARGSLPDVLQRGLLCQSQGQADPNRPAETRSFGFSCFSTTVGKRTKSSLAPFICHWSWLCGQLNCWCTETFSFFQCHTGKKFAPSARRGKCLLQSL